MSLWCETYGAGSSYTCFVHVHRPVVEGITQRIYFRVLKKIPTYGGVLFKQNKTHYIVHIHPALWRHFVHFHIRKQIRPGNPLNNCPFKEEASIFQDGCYMEHENFHFISLLVDTEKRFRVKKLFHIKRFKKK